MLGRHEIIEAKLMDHMAGEYDKMMCKISAVADPFSRANERYKAWEGRDDPQGVAGMDLNDLVRMRKGLQKGTNEYNEIQNAINEAYGVSKRHPRVGVPVGVAAPTNLQRPPEVSDTRYALNTPEPAQDSTQVPYRPEELLTAVTQPVSDMRDQDWDAMVDAAVDKSWLPQEELQMVQEDTVDADWNNIMDDQFDYMSPGISDKRNLMAKNNALDLTRKHAEIDDSLFELDTDVGANDKFEIDDSDNAADPDAIDDSMFQLNDRDPMQNDLSVYERLEQAMDEAGMESEGRDNLRGLLGGIRGGSVPETQMTEEEYNMINNVLSSGSQDFVEDEASYDLGDESSVPMPRMISPVKEEAVREQVPESVVKPVGGIDENTSDAEWDKILAEQFPQIGGGSYDGMYAEDDATMNFEDLDATQKTPEQGMTEEEFAEYIKSLSAGK